MTWISTLSGKKVDFVNPDPASICIEDIAAGLAAASRFVGQTESGGRWRQYTVAQHSWLASKMCVTHPLEALLHDAPEAYMCDCNRPLKDLLRPLWSPIESRLHAAICDAFGVDAEMPWPVKTIDDRLLMTERRDLQPRSPEWDTANAYAHATPFTWSIIPWPAEQARIAFLKRFTDLMLLEGRVA